MNCVSSLLKFSALSILLVGAEVSLLVYPVRSDSSPIQLANASACRAAISDAKNKLERVKNVRVSFVDNSEHGYERYPKNRPFRYVFALVGSGVDNVLSSPVFMQTIATKIIENCGSVGMVTFGLAQSGVVTHYGLMQNGQVQEFECLTPRDKVTWGYTVCI